VTRLDPRAIDPANGADAAIPGVQLEPRIEDFNGKAAIPIARFVPCSIFIGFMFLVFSGRRMGWVALGRHRFAVRPVSGPGARSRRAKVSLLELAR
jgi:hypothetical protein